VAFAAEIGDVEKRSVATVAMLRPSRGFGHRVATDRVQRVGVSGLPPRPVERFNRRVVCFLAERFFVKLENCALGNTIPGARLLETFYVPEDEVCLYLFESEPAGQAVLDDAFDRVVAVVPVAREAS
jgi:hypothetical protein